MYDARGMMNDARGMMPSEFHNTVTIQHSKKIQT